MPTVSAQDDLTADGTEQDVWDVTGNKHYFGYIDMENLASGDTILIRTYMKIRSAGVATLVQLSPTETFTDAQTNKILYFPPMPSDTEYKVTLEQSAGTFRVFPWKLFES